MKAYIEAYVRAFIPGAIGFVGGLPMSATNLRDRGFTSAEIDARLIYLASIGTTGQLIDLRGNSPRTSASDAAFLTLQLADNTILEDNFAMPTDVALVSNETSITVNWTIAQAEVAGYANGTAIERSTDNITFREIARVAYPTATYEDTDPTLVEEVEYFYRLRAFVGTGYSHYTVPVGTLLNQMDGVPTSLWVTNKTATTMYLEWVDGCTHEDGFSIERSEDNITFAEIATVEEDVFYYTDTVTANKLYWYRVRGYKGTTYSEYTNIANHFIGDLTVATKGKWSFDEVSGTTAIDSIGGNNGTITGATRVPGVIGTALSFNGTAGANHVLIGDVLDNVFAGVNRKFAIEFWVKPGANNLTANTIISKYNYTDKIYSFYAGLYTESKLRFVWMDSTADGINPDRYKTHTGSTAITNTSKWYHVIIQYDGTQLNTARCVMYVDGVKETVTLTGGAGEPQYIKDKNNKLCIGAQLNNSDVSASNFNGLIDSVSIYDTFHGANNIVNADAVANPAVYYDESVSADLRYLMTIEGTNLDGWLYKSADGLSFSLIKTLSKAEHLELKEIIKRADGRYFIYYSYGHAAGRRKIGAFLSDTTDPAGTWTDLGVVIDTTTVNTQKYSIGVFYENGLYYGFIGYYNGSEITMSLYTSRDGIAWVVKTHDWIPLSASGAWDDSMILNGRRFVKEGNDWRYYYTGHAESHATYPRQGRIGLTTIGYERVGGIEGVGNLVTTAFTATGVLNINANVGTGTLQVELLDSSDDSVLSGYSKDDCNALSGDTFETEVKWGANSIPTDVSVKVKFYLTGNAKLYAYNATSQTDALLDALYVDSVTGCTYMANKPVKYSGNPLFDKGTIRAIHDPEKLYSCTFKVGTGYKMYYSTANYETVARYFSCLATSIDGINWTKPVLNLINYDWKI